MLCNNTVLADWYDVPNGDQTNDNAVGKTPNLGIVNGMIGHTYDIVLDHHGYIIGMKEVVNISDGVGVITGIDTVRVGSGKYVSEVEAFMTDGTTKTFQLLGRNATAEAGCDDRGRLRLLRQYCGGGCRVEWHWPVYEARHG